MSLSSHLLFSQVLSHSNKKVTDAAGPGGACLLFLHPGYIGRIYRHDFKAGLGYTVRPCLKKTK
jgi:hypothetical protein